MAKKIFTFKGKTLEELQSMTIEQFAELVDSRARRTLKRGVNKKIMQKLENAKKVSGPETEPKVIRTHRRDIIVIPAMIGAKFAVHKGNEFVNVEVMPEMLGHYLGEFALTRKKLSHGKAGIGATRSSTAIATARG